MKVRRREQEKKYWNKFVEGGREIDVAETRIGGWNRNRKRDEGCSNIHGMGGRGVFMKGGVNIQYDSHVYGGGNEDVENDNV